MIKPGKYLLKGPQQKRGEGKKAQGQCQFHWTKPTASIVMKSSLNQTLWVAPASGVQPLALPVETLKEEVVEGPCLRLMCHSESVMLALMALWTDTVRSIFLQSLVPSQTSFHLLHLQSAYLIPLTSILSSQVPCEVGEAQIGPRSPKKLSRQRGDLNTGLSQIWVWHFNHYNMLALHVQCVKQIVFFGLHLLQRWVVFFF